MMKPVVIKYRNQRKTPPVLLVVCLLLIYLAGSIEIDTIHSVFHGSVKAEELHSDSNEDNACHQRLYHNQEDKGCDHPSHVVELKKCPMCELSLQSVQLLPEQQSIQYLPQANAFTLKLALATVYGRQVQPAPRAPPVAG